MDKHKKPFQHKEFEAWGNPEEFRLHCPTEKIYESIIQGGLSFEIQETLCNWNRSSSQDRSPASTIKSSQPKQTRTG
jgi:hypothetical protein